MGDTQLGELNEKEKLDVSLFLEMIVESAPGNLPFGSALLSPLVSFAGMAIFKEQRK